MKRKLNLATWNRREHYSFFSRMEEPFWGVSVEVDATQAYQYCKQEKYSFFLYYLYQSLVAANQVECFRYRIQNKEVVIYDYIHASATVNRPNGTFDFTYIPYSTDFQGFVRTALPEMRRARESSGLSVGISGDDVIHYSSLPWLRFKGLSHARGFARLDSCPKISFGKLTLENGKQLLPVSVHVHHGLVDGLDVGKFVEIFQKLLNHPQ
ncbi:MAG: CatA-like O-acetyltransferase [Saprospiraceae bacterium]